MLAAATFTTLMRNGFADAASAGVIRRNVEMNSRKARSADSVACLGSKDEAINIVLEAHDVEPKRPFVILGGRGRRRQSIDVAFGNTAAIDVFDPAGVEIFGQHLRAGARTTSRRSACVPPSFTPNTACAVLSRMKLSGAVKEKPSLGCRKRRPRTKPSLGSSP